MPDPAHIETDEILAEMEAEIYGIYEQASREMRGKAEDYLDWFRKSDREIYNQFKAGEISKYAYQQARLSHIMTGNHYRAMAAVLAEDMIHAQQIAASVINRHLPEVYAVNHNYGTYMIEHGARINTSYELYDVPTVERLIRDKPDLIPVQAIVKIPEAERWNMTQVSSIMTQSIVQGEDIPTIASRISSELPTRNRNAAIRDARTMTTSAQNGGREDAYKRAAGMGIEFEERWVATLDGRTRHAHRVLDGQKKPVGGVFKVDGYELEFPGDPKAPPYLVYNCRCTTIVDSEDMRLPRSFDGAFGYSRDDTLRDMTYDEWKADKGDTSFSKSARNRKADKEQYYSYRKLIGKDNMPADVREFQKIKYEKPDEWEKLKKEAANKRREKAERAKKHKK